VPTTIVNAHKIGVEREPNLDVLEYLLYALMLRPVVRRSAIEEIETGMRLVKEQVEPESVELELPIDRYAITKLAMAICRLDGKDEIDDSAFSKSKETFFELYREFLDTRRDHFKPGKGSYGRKGVRSQVSGQLSANDMILLSYVRKISRQQGKEYVTVQDLKVELGKKRYQRYDLDRALERLNNFGRVIRSENMSAFKPIDLE
jgi:stalled ribosome alternative rescue factor ArfA